MKKQRQGSMWVRRMTALLAVMTAAVLMVMPAAAATVTASDVMIRNSGEEKSDNIIGVLNEGDQVTVRSKSTDQNGTEWFLVELPNGNTGYVKAQWIDNGGEDVETVQTPAQEEDQAGPEEEAAQTQEASEDDLEGIDDWTEEDADMLEGTPVVEGDDLQEEGADETAQSQEAPDVDNGQTYDPYTDPNAQYSINFVTESDGTGNWYIYNYDTDKRIRIGDLEKLSDAQNAAQKSAASAGIWRTAACILLILLIAIVVFLYLSSRRNGGGRPAPSTRRNRRRARERDEEDEDDDFDWSSEDEDESEEDAYEEESRTSGRTIPAGGKSDDEDASDEEDSYDEEDSDGEEDAYEEDESDEDEDSYDEEDEDYDEDGEYEERTSRKRGVLGFLKNIFTAGDVDDEYDEDDYDDEEDEDDYDEEDSGDSEEEYEEEEAEDEEDEEEDVRPARRNRGRRETASRRPAPRPRKRPAPTIEFDEESDYPEDAELLSFVKESAAETAEDESTAEVLREPEKAAAAADAVSKSAGRAKQGGQKKSAGAAVPEPEEDEEFFADEDDDMEYSFLAGSSRRTKG